MEKQYLVLGGIALLAVVLVAGMVFTPSGFLSVNIPKMNYACTNAQTMDRCDGQNDYWSQYHWSSEESCLNARDDFMRPCQTYTDCHCTTLKEE
jgi:hypothetical protein